MKHFAERGHVWGILDEELGGLVSVPSKSPNGDKSRTTSTWLRREDARNHKPHGQRFQIVKLRLKYEVIA